MKVQHWSDHGDSQASKISNIQDGGRICTEKLVLWTHLLQTVARGGWWDLLCRLIGVIRLFLPSDFFH